MDPKKKVIRMSLHEQLTQKITSIRMRKAAENVAKDANTARPKPDYSKVAFLSDVTMSLMNQCNQAEVDLLSVCSISPIWYTNLNDPLPNFNYKTIPTNLWSYLYSTTCGNDANSTGAGANGGVGGTGVIRAFNKV